MYYCGWNCKWPKVPRFRVFPKTGRYPKWKKQGQTIEEL